MRRVGGVLSWVAPSLAALALYWLGLWIWFYQDDFAWLNLGLRLRQGESLWKLLFFPEAQGTIRPLSERAFFLVFHGLFGLNAFPYRLWISATLVADLLLLGVVARKLTRSRLAGLFAPLLWAANESVAVALSWISSYNQVLLTIWILLALYCLLRHAETGRKRYYIFQWLAFLAALGTLELAVAYPAIAVAYSLCCARGYLKWTVPFAGIAAAYALLHHAVAPGAASGPYAQHWDGSILSTLAKYWILAFGGNRLGEVLWDPWLALAGSASAWVASLSVLGFVLWKTLRRQWLAAFLLAWFLVMVGPVLPLRDHFTAYYLTVPTVGLAVLGGWALAEGWRAGWKGRSVVVLVAGAYLAASIPVCRQVIAWSYLRGGRVRSLVLGVGHAQQLHPGKVILLDGVDSELFWSGVRDRPFRLVGAPDVFLTPKAEEGIAPHPELGEVSGYVLPQAAAARLLDNKLAVVYDAQEPLLRNITWPYRATYPRAWRKQLARRIDVGLTWFQDQLGDGWHPIQGGYRWMKKRAVVRLGGPEKPGDELWITGFASVEQLAHGPVRLMVEINGTSFDPVLLTRGDAQFDFHFPLPSGVVQQGPVEVVLEVDRTFRAAGETRELGAAFGIFAIR